jgi:hypothetical protein
MGLSRMPLTGSLMRLCVGTIVVALLGTAISAPGVARGDPNVELCSEIVAAAIDLEARIDVHNAKPHHFELPRQAAASNAYEAERVALVAEQAAIIPALAACEEAERGLSGLPNGPPVPAPTTAALDRLQSAARSVPWDWRPTPTTTTAPGVVRVSVPATSPVRPLYDVARTMAPVKLSRKGDVHLNGSPPPKAGALDPAYPPEKNVRIGKTTTGEAAVSADHIVPLAEIVQMPGFHRLSPRNMYAVINAPSNLQWLSFKANRAKSAIISGLVPGLDPEFAERLRTQQEQQRAELQRIIDSLLKSQDR